MTKRLACCVPFCKRTTARAEFLEWICGDHWRLVPLAERKVYGRHVKQWRRYHHADDGAAADRIWERLKRIATEAALGI